MNESTDSDPKLFVSSVHVRQLRHLKDIEIPISQSEKKHLILTGRNGSGKTSLLLAIAQNIVPHFPTDPQPWAGISPEAVEVCQSNKKEAERRFNKGQLPCVLLMAKRGAAMSAPSGVRPVNFPQSILIQSQVSSQFLQYLVSMKAQSSFARDDGDTKSAEKIEQWFASLEHRLRTIFEDDTLKLVFDRSRFEFLIHSETRGEVPLTALSDGYSAILTIIAEIILRMEAAGFQETYPLQGFVLIDEIETHLHIELQKLILPFLTDFFPNLQFIVTTHSPFVLSSSENAVVFDLENQEAVTDLTAYSSEALVESYFDSDKYSNLVKSRVSELEKLVGENGSLPVEKKNRRDELLQYFSDRSGKLDLELEVKIGELRLKLAMEK